jgi:hypothetical protein
MEDLRCTLGHFRVRILRGLFDGCAGGLATRREGSSRFLAFLHGFGVKTIDERSNVVLSIQANEDPDRKVRQVIMGRHSGGGVQKMRFLASRWPGSEDS